MPESLESRVKNLFADYKKRGFSSYMAVRTVSKECNISMKDVGSILHPKGIKHAVPQTPKENTYGK